MSKSTHTLLNTAGRHVHLVVPFATVVILLVLLVPLPTWMLDILISFNLMLSVIVLLVSIYVLQPVQFTSFPSLLLLTTLFRLALNVATSRLILLNGEAGENAAGSVIKAFGEFVIGGNYGVGIVIFLILLVIQFIVVNHGAVRSSEVMARFTLDAMPGKQMAVDADLAAGIIDEKVAKHRRAEINQAAEFHGSMDGAIRFTQRDAVASILITGVNILAGFTLGVLQHDMSVVQAGKTYTILTIGDGVAAAIPSLLISVAAAIITTRAAHESHLSGDISAQLLLNPRPLYITAGVLAMLGILPGMPHVAFLTLALMVSGIGFLSSEYQQKILEKEALQSAQLAQEAAAEPSEPIEALTKLDVLALEIGYGLIPLVSSNPSFLARIREIRRQIAVELGIIVSPVHITDNLQLPPNEYTILLKGERIASGEVRPDCLMAIDPGIVREQLEGTQTIEPVFKMPALWVNTMDRERALSAGYTVVDPITVVCTHLSEVIKDFAPELLGRQETRGLLDEFAKTHPKTVEETTPKVLSLGEVQRVLQNLLREHIPIRDLASILEVLADVGALTHDINAL
ncbi:MAG TPA: flagellar biosynthesis protein FlhA, partial [Acidobacteriota bacterium]|nr:flagellar biosynthesis protein FlhA [Acidobacteriota bacterium]